MLETQTKAMNSIASNMVIEAPQSNQPLLIEFTERLGGELKRQTSMITQIQDTLHRIYDKRTPEKTSEEPVADLSDISSKTRYIQNRLEANNMLIERILNHLSAII